MYTIPRAAVNDSCVRETHSLPLLRAVQLQLNKPVPVELTVNVTVKGEDTQCKFCVDICIILDSIKSFNYCLGILAVFPVGITTWTMNNDILLSMGHDSLQLSIKLPENSNINMIITSPYQANAVIGIHLNYSLCVL